MMSLLCLASVTFSQKVNKCLRFLYSSTAKHGGKQEAVAGNSSFEIRAVGEGWAAPFSCKRGYLLLKEMQPEGGRSPSHPGGLPRAVCEEGCPPGTPHSLPHAMCFSLLACGWQDALLAGGEQIPALGHLDPNGHSGQDKFLSGRSGGLRTRTVP